MSPFEYVCAAYRHRHSLAPQLFTLFALGIILSYHAMTNPILDWIIK